MIPEARRPPSPWDGGGGEDPGPSSLIASARLVRISSPWVMSASTFLHTACGGGGGGCDAVPGLRGSGPGVGWEASAPCFTTTTQISSHFFFQKIQDDASRARDVVWTRRRSYQFHGHNIVRSSHANLH